MAERALMARILPFRDVPDWESPPLARQAAALGITRACRELAIDGVQLVWFRPETTVETGYRRAHGGEWRWWLDEDDKRGHVNCAEPDVVKIRVGLSELDTYETVLHEAKHVQQHRIGDCTEHPAAHRFTCPGADMGILESEALQFGKAEVALLHERTYREERTPVGDGRILVKLIPIEDKEEPSNGTTRDHDRP